MLQIMILKNLTNSPQVVAGHRIPARGTSEPMELDAATERNVRACGLFSIVDPLDHDGDGKPGGSVDAFDQMSTDELRELYEVVTGRKPHPKTGRDKLLETVRADG